MNIIQNSLEAMPQGGKIVLSAQVIPSDNLVVIMITDTGLGMAPDLVKKVCDPFSAQKPERERDYAGWVWLLYGIL